jgi:hypothetical protein
MDADPASSRSWSAEGPLDERDGAGGWRGSHRFDEQFGVAPREEGRPRWVTHEPTGDIVDAYTTLPWATLCEAVSGLRIAVSEGNVLQFRAASERPAVGDGLEADASTPGAEKVKARRTEPSGL